ncbi:MAG: hypothetical protein J0I77_08060 [Rudaea sp.]|uniref:hypothetical protein n=1 Tax=unclassified Rudaea TaxID=2627037 RepID=UPI0010F5E8B0|nr:MULTISPECIES: hypothetical protein [unclassified Rudaea]MBN8885661.1 hypothetical protein [Rudaea sp.]MBR0346373.1 hypothetical protein [Rudaea sp.]
MRASCIFRKHPGAGTVPFLLHKNIALDQLTALSLMEKQKQQARRQSILSSPPTSMQSLTMTAKALAASFHWRTQLNLLSDGVFEFEFARSSALGDA